MDEAAFNSIVRENCRAWQLCALKITGNADDADDAVQMALVDAWNGRGRFLSRSKYSTWIYSITVHKAYDSVRKRESERRKLERAAELADTETHSDNADADPVQKLHLAVAKLPEPCKNAVGAMIACAMDYSAASERLGCPQSILYWRMHKAKKLLKEMLK